MKKRDYFTNSTGARKRVATCEDINKNYTIKFNTWDSILAQRFQGPINNHVIYILFIFEDGHRCVLIVFCAFSFPINDRVE